MSCSDVHGALLRGEVPTGPGADAHLRSCDACAALVDDEGALAGALGAEDDPSPDDMAALLSSVKSAVERETGARAWARSRSTPARLVGALAAVAALAAVVATGSPRGDLAEMSKLRLLSAMVLYGGLAFACLLVAMRPLQRPSLAPSAGRGLIVAGLAVAVGFALAPAASGLSLWSASPTLVPEAMTCFAFGAALAVPLLGVGWLLDRGGYAGGGRLLLAAGSAGLAGSLFLELHCDMQMPAHLMLGHVTVVVALLGGGLILSTLQR